MTIKAKVVQFEGKDCNALVYFWHWLGIVKGGLWLFVWDYQIVTTTVLNETLVTHKFDWVVKSLKPEEMQNGAANWKQNTTMETLSPEPLHLRKILWILKTQLRR